MDPITPTGVPSPHPTSATHYVLDTMAGWNLDWDSIREVLKHYDSSLWWLAIAILGVFILGTQLIFFPLFYRAMKMQAPTAMRLAYLVSLLVTVVLFHWWLWHWIFFALTKNYWVWLIWGLFSLIWIGLIVWIPKKRLES